MPRASKALIAVVSEFAYPDRSALISIDGRPVIVLDCGLTEVEKRAAIRRYTRIWRRYFDPQRKEKPSD